MKIYTKIMDVFAAIEKFILIVTGLGTTFITFFAVVGRKTGWYKFTWSEEIVINVFIIMIMCGCALAARDGGLISLSLIYDAVPLKAKKLVATISNVVNVVFYVIVIKTGFNKVATQIATNKRTSILLWPEWIFMLFLPVGAILLLLHTVEHLMKVYAMKEEPAAVPSGKEAEQA
ncbi:MAG: TRAP transporter small permease [Oscillospiraceae bacterium]|nr:TRAP transporter small permease [Oscillospiraceae bacterium]